MMLLCIRTFWASETHAAPICFSNTPCMPSTTPVVWLCELWKMATQPAKAFLRAACILLLWQLCLHGCFSTVSNPIRREKEGNRVPLQLGVLEHNEDVPAQDVALITKMKHAGNRGEWLAVLAAFKASSKSSAAVFNTAMAAALRCGKFKKGTQIYRQLDRLQIQKTLKSYCCGIRLHAECEQPDQVTEIWNEARAQEFWAENESACSAMCAMLHAVSKTGDVSFAASLLDQMERRGKVLNILDWNQALNACRLAGKPNAAAFLLNQLTSRDVQPTVVTFSLVIGAHSGRPLAEILPYVDRMTAQGIQPSSLLVEDLVCSILGLRRRPGHGWEFVKTAAQARLMMSETPPAHKAEALRILKNAQKQGIELSILMQRFRKALLKKAT